MPTCDHSDSVPCTLGKSIAGMVLGAFSQASSTDQITRTDGKTMTRFLDSAGEVFATWTKKGVNDHRFDSGIGGDSFIHHAGKWFGK